MKSSPALQIIDLNDHSLRRGFEGDEGLVESDDLGVQLTNLALHKKLALQI